MTSKELNEITKIPYDTLRNWKNIDNGYRKKLYEILINTNKDELIKIFSKDFDSDKYSYITIKKISDFYQMPYRTLQEWKRADDYKSRLYTFLAYIITKS